VHTTLRFDVDITVAYEKPNGLHRRSDVYTPSGSRNYAKF